MLAIYCIRINMTNSYNYIMAKFILLAELPFLLLYIWTYKIRSRTNGTWSYVWLSGFRFSQQYDNSSTY